MGHGEQVNISLLCPMYLFSWTVYQFINILFCLDKVSVPTISTVTSTEPHSSQRTSKVTSTVTTEKTSKLTIYIFMSTLCPQQNN